MECCSWRTETGSVVAWNLPTFQEKAPDVLLLASLLPPVPAGSATQPPSQRESKNKVERTRTPLFSLTQQSAESNPLTSFSSWRVRTTARSSQCGAEEALLGQSLPHQHHRSSPQQFFRRQSEMKNRFKSESRQPRVNVTPVSVLARSHGTVALPRSWRFTRRTSKCGNVLRREQACSSTQHSSWALCLTRSPRGACDVETTGLISFSGRHSDTGGGRTKLPGRAVADVSSDSS